ncbi:MAG: hypothetical protein CME62_17555 [Halobacteriovoraceae bacterium]|nr:hypothetical protein [Halobacteriovoraceae bacterium]|tara:strand:- start:31874 stop:32353 length:480 start_codon:yes stop_codon:yes gene_type:complete
MTNFLNEKYTHLGATRFAKLAPIICFLSDLLVLYYVTNQLLPRLLSPGIVKQMLSLRGIYLSMNDAKEVAQLFSHQMSFILFCFLVFHFVIYTLAFLKKKCPMKYIHNYAFFAVIFTVLEIALFLYSQGNISLLTFVSFWGYFFVWYGYKIFRKSELQN